MRKYEKSRVVWLILLIAGIIPLILPFLTGLYRMSIESWTMGDWLITYSFIYWPTYLLGPALMGVSTYKLTSIRSRAS